MNPRKNLEKDQPSKVQIAAFREVVWDFAGQGFREMPWRTDVRPYYILVSELMLQQTQVGRVIPKFEAFIARFPDEEMLARAPLSEVVVAWQGLGYNRRAKFLHEAARAIVTADEFPRTLSGLMALPGVGRNTAGAIMNYAFEQPVAFVETNVRTALIEHFYPDGEIVNEADFLALAELIWDNEHPRAWAWAVMDYGAHLKSQGRGRLTQVKTYKKQSPLRGSLREMRGRIIAALSQAALPDAELREQVVADERFAPALEGLIKDGLIARAAGVWSLIEA